MTVPLERLSRNESRDMTPPLEHLSRNGRLARFFIDGAWRVPKGAATADVVNPATEAVVARFPLGNREDVDAAVAAARRAFAGWSRTSRNTARVCSTASRRCSRRAASSSRNA